MTGATVRAAQNPPEFWMVITTKNGAQTPYNFQTQDKAEQFLQNLAGDAKIDGVQLMKMQSTSKSPVTYHAPNIPDGIMRPPVKGKPVQPKLLEDHNADLNVEMLNIPGLEWAGHGSLNGSHYYEFIGHFNAIIALGCVEHSMLDVGRSGKKHGEGFETQAFVNERFRLELQTDTELNEEGLKAAKTSPRSRPAQTHDPISTALKSASNLIHKYPSNLRGQLSAGICDSNGNGWQLLESFPLLAVRVFAFNDQAAVTAKALVRRGAKTREIAEAVNVPMCFKRFVPKATNRLLKVRDLLSKHTDVVSHHCPERAADQGSWLSNIRKARSSGNSEFAIWVAVHWPELVAIEKDLHSLQSKICDLRDWVRACVVQQIGSAQIDSICQLINDKEAVSVIEKWWESYFDLAEAGKSFNKKMSLQTVIKLSEEWHERQAAKDAADVEFPQEWYEGGIVGNFRIEPIRTAPELSKYGYHLHNCATQYAHQIADGNCFFYVVFEGDELKAMFEIKPTVLTRNSRANGGNIRSGVRTTQLQGPRNSEVSEELKTAVDSWSHECKPPAKPQPVEVSEAVL